MKKINIFNKQAPLHRLRWYIVTASIMICWLAYSNYTGWRLFSTNSQQSWSASGTGGHK